MNNTELLPDALPANPLPIIEQWLNQAMEEAQRPNPNSMSLATVSETGAPSVRVVLCKELQCDPGYMVFYTNYLSAKGNDIDGNPKVAISMHWDRAGRQVRAEGILIKSPDVESDAYFNSRDRGSRIGAWASDQSAPIGSRSELENKFIDVTKRFDGEDIPRPPHWGGYRLWFTAVELWVSLESRLHDRARWEREVTLSPEPVSGDWTCRGRLQP